MPDIAEVRTTEVHNVARLDRHLSWTKGGPVATHLPEDEISTLEDRATATVADPGPMGLWAFATGTWIMGAVAGGAFPLASMIGVAPVLIAFAGVAQFIAGLFAYRRAHALLATAFCCLGAFNVTSGLTFVVLASGSLAPQVASNTVVFQGFLMMSFGFITLSLALAALRANMATFAVFALLCVGYVLAGIPWLVNSVGAGGWGIIGNIGGWFLVASAFFAYYTGAALVVNSTWKRTLLPIFGEA
jgi:succinate-acetate transporter protein